MQEDAHGPRAKAIPIEDAVDRIRDCARQSIGRGVLFGLLGIAATIGGLIGWPVVAMRLGAHLSMLMMAVLVLRGLRAPRNPYKRTETWLLLDRRHGLPERDAQATISGILAETYWLFAERAAILALGFWIAAFVFAMLRG